MAACEFSEYEVVGNCLLCVAHILAVLMLGQLLQAEDKERNALWARRFSIVPRILSTGTLLNVGAGIGTFLHIAKKNGFDEQGNEVSDKP